MRRVRRFRFTSTVYFTDTYGGVCWRNATALLSQAQWTAQAIACLIALLLPCFNIQINASGSSTTFVRFRTPNPEGEFESSRKLHTSPIQNLRQILGFAICWNITGSNPCWIKEVPKGQRKLLRIFNRPLCSANKPQPFEHNPIQQMYRL
jgi:hypothetical protein